MSLAPDPVELLSRARADLRMGVPVVIHGAAPIVVAAVETLDKTRFDDLRALGQDCVLAITARRAETLKVPAYDGDLARVNVPRSVSFDWASSIADPADDLMSPMKGPLHAVRGGDADTCRFAIQLAKASRLLPAVFCAPVDNASDFARQHNLICIAPDFAQGLPEHRSPLHHVISARVPLEVSEAGKLHVFRPDDGAEEHYAIEIGTPDRGQPVLTRLHSACFTGDLMGSLKCDCGPQLRAALALMGQEGHGVLLYMNQEGRGIGLANKMRAYSLQDQGFDTVDANHRLGFEDDERDFRLGSDILRALGFSQARLITNNPRKVEMMQASGITVTMRVPLHVGENSHNRAYLATKIAKSGHLK